jgi:antitoxin ParD1/3/4
MNVPLTPQVEDLIRQKIESGRYSDANEVVQEALRLLDARDRLVRLRAAIAHADEQVARGEVETWTPDFIDRLLQEAAEEERAGIPICDDVTP